MIKLRPEQIELFDALAERLFYKRMVEHVQIHFQDEIEELSLDDIEKRVSAQIKKAQSYQFNQKPDICDFISLCWHFGDEFDSQYKTKWAADILNDPSVKDPGIKMAKLNDQANLILNN
jgi:hypothetical protein